MLSRLTNTVHIDPDWVAEEYPRRCEVNDWDVSEDEGALKCWNLERIIVDADLAGAPRPAEITMAEFMS